jgi:hypothetical protein
MFSRGIVGQPMRPGLVLLLLLPAACGSKDNVGLSGSVENVAISFESVTLGSRLSGGFDLRLELGEQAPETSTVTLGGFSLQAEQQELAALAVLDDAGSFPMNLEPGQTRRAELTLDDRNTLAVERPSLCNGPLRIVGTVSSSAGGRVTPVASAELLLDGC